MFWIIFGGIGLFAIPSALMFITCGATTKNKIGGAAFCICFWLLTSVLLWGQEVGNQERWNNGFCECGEHWELSAVDKSKSGTETKYYSCPACYNEIEIIH